MSRLAMAQRIGVVCLLVLLLSPQPISLGLQKAFLTAQQAVRQNDPAALAPALAEAAARLAYDATLAQRAALAELAVKQFDAALRHTQQAATLEGWSVEKRLIMGDAYAGKGDLAAAITQWEQAQQLAPHRPEALLRLSQAYETLGRYAEATTALNTLAQTQATDATIYYRLVLLSAAVNPHEAASRLVTALDLNPTLADRLRPLLTALEDSQATGDDAYLFGRVGFELIQLKEWGLAEIALKRATELNHTYADAFTYLGFALDMQKKESLAAYDTALRLTPNSPLVNFFYGLHWRRLGESRQALPYLQQAQTLDPQNPAIAAEIGGAHASLGDLTQAEQWFSQAVELAPRDADFWLLLARFSAEQEFHVAETGLPAARMAVGLASTNSDAHDALGYALFLTDDLINAEKALLEALRLNPTSPAGYYHLGLLYARLGKTEEAKAALDHVLAIDTEGAYGAQALRARAVLP